MALVDVTFDTSQPRRFLQQKLDSIRVVRPQLGFDLYNVARDLAAIDFNRPNQAIYYYEALNSGRRGFEVHIGSRGPNRSPTLRFKISESEWVVTLEVGPVEPRRITEASLARLNGSLRTLITQAAGTTRMPLPDGPQLVQLVRAMQQEVIRVFSEVTLERTILYNVKENFYHVFGSIPLSEGFRTVPRGSAPPTA